MTEIRTRAFVGFIGVAVAGILTASFSTSGCSSSSTTGTAGTSGSAGTTGHAGTTGSAGTSGSAGTTGTAGTTGGGGSSAALCTGGPLTGAPLITDFSDVAPADGGNAGDNSIPGKGGILGYNGVTVAIANGAAHATGTVAAGVYGGVALYFSSCIDATAYTGVKFKLTGDFGTCDMLKLGVNFPQIEPPPPASGFGVCSGTNCYGPGSAYTVATTMVTFASMSGGGAVATVTADAQNRITGIGWGFHGPAAADGSAGGCMVDFTIDDVMFY